VNAATHNKNTAHAIPKNLPVLELWWVVGLGVGVWASTTHIINASMAANRKDANFLIIFLLGNERDEIT
jgi:hypothetical protein